MNYFLITLLAYLVGNFSSSCILCKLTNREDLRKFGSGNAGATNALRVYGKKLGLATLILDISKGFFSSYIGYRLGGLNGQLLASIGVVLGHDWPIFLQFRGGKGIATSIGVLLALDFKLASICILIGIIIIYLTRYVSLASILGSSLAPFFSILTIKPFNIKIFLTLVFLAFLAVLKHKDNIIRLKNNEEPRLGEKRSE